MSAIAVRSHRLLSRFWRQCRPRRRWQLGVLFVLMLLTALAEVISLGAVLPFIGALTSPDKLLTRSWIAAPALALGIDDQATLLGWLTGAFICAALLAAALRLLLLWFNHRFTAALGSELAVEAFRRALHQPLSFHIQRHSSALVSLVTRKLDVSITVGVLYALMFASAMVMALAITVALLWIDAPMAVLMASLLGSAYLLISWWTRAALAVSSQQAALEQDRTVRVLQEGLGAVRDVLLDGTQDVYCEAYRQADQTLRRSHGMSLFTATSPRYATETLGIVLIALIAWRLSGGASGLVGWLPTLAALALGAQRLLPALQQAFSGWAGIVANADSMADALDVLELPVESDRLQRNIAPLRFHSGIAFEGVSFRYWPDGPDVLNDVRITIERGARVGIVGSSGSGKSTLLDLIMGLLEPTRGRIIVDGEPLDGARRRAWQLALAHVPQDIFLADTSLAANIAFGVRPELLDMKKVEDAARRANLAEYIASCPQGYDTRVGERGVRLSGGQRQRVGIARAFYKGAQVLILDEATNALDDVTEQGILETLAAIDRDITILVVAHRASTLRHCDYVIEVCDRIVRKK